MNIQMIILIAVLIVNDVRISQCYGLEISVNGVASAPDTTGDFIGETVILDCSVDENLVDARLEWLDGRVPIRNSLANVAIRRNASTVTLHIRDFTLDNYGQYRCRCVKDYTNPPLLNPHHHVSFDDVKTALENRITGDVLCSTEKYVQLMPENRSMIEERFVTQSQRLVELECSSGLWSVNRAHSQSGPERISNQSVYSINVTKSTDQAKVICLDSTDFEEALDKIFYISIEGYNQLPLSFNRPLHDGGTIAANADEDTSPILSLVLCMIQPNLPRDVNVSISINGDKYERRKTLYINGVHMNVHFEDKRIILTLIHPPGSLDYLYHTNFSCKAESLWEPDVTVNFKIVEPVATTIEPFTVAAINSSIIPDAPDITSNHPSPSVIPSTTQLPPFSSSPSVTHSPFRPSPSMIPSTTQGHAKGDVFNAAPFIIGGILAALIIIAVAVCFIVCFSKRCRKSRKHQIYNCRELLIAGHSYNRNNSQEMSPLAPFHSSALAQFSFYQEDPLSKVPPYIRELEENQTLFPYENLELGQVLGTGAFGIVRKAIAYNFQPDGSSVTVAIKMLKDDGTEEERRDLVSELKVLQHVGAHPNIVSLLGASLHAGSLHIIVEYCGNGNLLYFLRSKRSDQFSPLTSKHSMDMARQVASGMEHLAARNCIHRDLAARNVLVTDNLVLKVADFGLARKMYESIYRPSGGRVPIKWMSPETILDREYTTQSDVWSFGILLWEIMSLGRSPYPGKSAEEMVKCIGEGYRMPSPDGCPQEVYSLMMKCWDEEPSLRPNFSDLCMRTEELKKEFEAMELKKYHYHNLPEEPNNQPIALHGSELCCHCMAEIEATQCSHPLILQEGKESFCSCDYQYVNVNLDTHGALKNKLSKSVMLPLMPGHLSVNSEQRSSSISYLPVIYNSNERLPCTIKASSAAGISDPGLQSMDSESLCSDCKVSCQQGSLDHQEEASHAHLNHFHPEQSASLASSESSCADNYRNEVSTPTDLSSITACAYKGEITEPTNLSTSSESSYKNETMILSATSDHAESICSSLLTPKRGFEYKNWPIPKVKISSQVSDISMDSGRMTMTPETLAYFDFKAVNELVDQTCVELSQESSGVCTESSEENSEMHGSEVLHSKLFSTDEQSFQALGELKKAQTELDV